MRSFRFDLLIRVCILLVVFAQAGFSQIKEAPENAGQERKPKVDLNSSSDIDLENTNWLLVEIKGYILPELIRPVYLRFDKKESLATASGLCNTIRGNYKRNKDKSSLEISLKPITLLGCEPENDVELALSEAMKKSNRFKISGENLYLYKGKTLLINLIAKK